MINKSKIFRLESGDRLQVTITCDCYHINSLINWNFRLEYCLKGKRTFNSIPINNKKESYILYAKYIDEAANEFYELNKPQFNLL